MTGRLRRADGPRACKCAELGRRHCIDRLLPVQAWCLWELSQASGLFAQAGVGSGKTGMDILAPLVVPDCKVAALLVPSPLVEQFKNDYLAWREHFRVPSLILPGADGGWYVTGAPRLHLIPYGKLSREEFTVELDSIAPDLIIADECHKVRNKTAARTVRFLRCFADRPETRFCGWSGTVASKSIIDFGHLAAFALGEGSPLPLDPEVVDQWAAAVDPSDWPAPAGVLKKLCAPGEKVREALARRIWETPGAVSTPVGAGVAALTLRERTPKVPAKIETLLRDLDRTWMRPDGEELVEALDKARCARELACGFYYRWIFPDGPAPEDVEDWFAARKAWHRELREALKNPQPHLDSPLLLTRAAQRYHGEDESEGPSWESEAWPDWRDIRDTIRHETEAVWVDDYLVRDAAAWAKANRGIVWYAYEAFGRAVAEASGLPLHGGGPGADARLRAEKGDRSIIASIRSHGEGRDGLQHLFCAQLVANPPASADAWEQLLGRLDRVGQQADEVVTVVYRQTVEMAEDLDRALDLAKFVEDVTTSTQKLRAANVEFTLGVGGESRTRRSP